jgi:hypothetical protein
MPTRLARAILIAILGTTTAAQTQGLIGPDDARRLRPIDTVAIKEGIRPLILELVLKATRDSIEESEFAEPTGTLIVRDCLTGRILQRLDSLGCARPLCLLDINLDGYRDLQIQDDPGNAVSRAFSFRLFDSLTSQFVYAPDFEGLGEYVVDSTARTLSENHVSPGGKENDESVSRIDRNTLVPLQRSSSNWLEEKKEEYVGGRWHLQEQQVSSETIDSIYGHVTILRKYKRVRDSLMLEEELVMKPIPGMPTAIQFRNHVADCWPWGQSYLFLQKTLFHPQGHENGRKSARCRLFVVIHNEWICAKNHP